MISDCSSSTFIISSLDFPPIFNPIDDYSPYINLEASKSTSILIESLKEKYFYSICL